MLAKKAILFLFTFNASKEFLFQTKDKHKDKFQLYRLTINIALHSAITFVLRLHFKCHPLPNPNKVALQIVNFVPWRSVVVFVPFIFLEKILRKQSGQIFKYIFSWCVGSLFNFSSGQSYCIVHIASLLKSHSFDVPGNGQTLLNCNEDLWDEHALMRATETLVDFALDVQNIPIIHISH